MARLLPDGLRAIIEPTLPPPGSRGGRPPITHRQALTGIPFVLKTGPPREDLPAATGCGSGMTCWRRLRDWQAGGTWDRLHATRLDRLHDAGRLDWSTCAIDGSSVRAVFGGQVPARTPRAGARTGRSTTCWWTGRGPPRRAG